MEGWGKEGGEGKVKMMTAYGGLKADNLVNIM